MNYIKWKDTCTNSSIPDRRYSRVNALTLIEQAEQIVGFREGIVYSIHPVVTFNNSITIDVSCLPIACI